MWRSWVNPRPLITSNREKLVIHEDTARLLEEVNLPVVVVVIAGIYRTGKSYLMNRLAARKSGFPLGDTLQSKTKGIWVWCLPHPRKRGHALLLLDTEGLSDPEKASDKDDMQLLCLSMLLSSLFVYNAIGKIDQEMMNRLYFLSQVLDSIRARDMTPTQLKNVLPDFALVVRDFSLELRIDNKPVTSDEYFKRVLENRRGPNRANDAREAIQGLFCSHRCFVFTRPVEDDDLFCKLESLKESDLSPLFLQQSNEFCQFVHANAKAKKVKADDKLVLSGKVWLSLAREYTSTINRGAVPAVESTFLYIAARTNQLAVDQSMIIYGSRTRQLVFPEYETTVNSAHKLASNAALTHFQQQVIGDENGKYLTILNTRLTHALASLTTSNQQATRDHCNQTLESIYNAYMRTKIESNYYFCTNGLYMYQTDLHWLKNTYNTSVMRNGGVHDIVFQEFLQQMVSVEECIKRSLEELEFKERARIEQRRIADEARRQELETQRRLEDERRRTEEARRIREETRRRAEAEHERQLQEAKERQQEELRRRQEEEAERMRQEHEADKARLRRQAEDSDSDGPCTIL